jgi:outer membrane protein assembly factor BamA
LFSISSAAAATEGYPDRFQLVLGGLREGSSLAVGAEYEHTHFANGFFDLRLSSRVSIRLYQRHEAELVIPHFLDPRLFVEVLALYRSYTQVAYFGIGSETAEEDHSDYHAEGPAFYATLGFRPAHNVSVGGRLGRLDTDLHSGKSGRFPSIEEAFAPSELPGYVEEPDFYLYGAFAAVDLRNDRHDPTSGAYYELQATRYRDRGFDRFQFEEIQFDAQHFVPVGFRMSYAVRVHGLFTRAGAGQEVPFYLLPSLGGTESFHAFEMDRFRDRNLLFMNNELRYQATPEVRVGVFVDVGQVYPSANALRLSSFELGTGLAVYYKSGDRVLVGLSVGFGREGPRAAVRGDFRF